MGDVAASGGYYIACPAEAIVALPATLTGSIGVFGGKLVVDGLLARIGVSTGTVQQGERALMYSSRRGFSEDERARFAATIDAIYSEFVAKVAAGRKRAVAEIEAVAAGDHAVQDDGVVLRGGDGFIRLVCVPRQVDHEALLREPPP